MKRRGDGDAVDGQTAATQYLLPVKLASRNQKLSGKLGVVPGMGEGMGSMEGGGGLACCFVYFLSSLSFVA